jgi:formylglycine-generating enzyme required for sulfatase activity
MSFGRKVRLPTEAEWEYACRAGTKTPFSFGETISSAQANYDSNAVYGKGRVGIYRQETVAAGSFPPNDFGLYGMHGNVWEWCGDGYDDYPNEATDPIGDPESDEKVMRGGSWFNEPILCRSATRASFNPQCLNFLIGFRVAVEV